MQLDYSKFYKKFLIILLTQLAMRLLNSIVSFFIIVLIVSYGFGQIPWVRFSLCVLSLFISVYFVLLIILKWKKYASVNQFSKYFEMESEKFSGFFSAYEFTKQPLRPGISNDLKDAFVQDVQNTLTQNSSKNIFKIKNKKHLFISFLSCIIILIFLFILPPKFGSLGMHYLLFGIQGDFDRNVYVMPKNSVVKIGEKIEITAELLHQDIFPPQLYIKTNSGWEEIIGTIQGSVSMFNLNSVTSQVKYYVKWKNLKSPIYEIIPEHPPFISDLKFKLCYPKYTSLASKTVSQNDKITVWRGTLIELTGAISQKVDFAELLTSQNIQYPVQFTDSEHIYAKWVVRNPHQFWIELKNKNKNILNHKVLYDVSIQEDQSPQIKILAPVADLLVGQEAIIPITYELKDDMGVSNLFINITQLSNDQKERRLLKKYNSGVLEKLETINLEMSSLKVQSGDVFKVQLEIHDGDTIAGPKIGFSQSFLIEILSYEKEHKKNEKDFSNLRDQMLDLLADQLNAKLPKLDWKAFEKESQLLVEKTASFIEKQTNTNQKAEKIEKDYSSLLKRMEKDPLTDMSSFSEYQSILNALQNLRNETMSQSLNNMKKNEFNEASELQEQSISELEKMTQLSEDVYKYSKMKNLIDSADRLQTKGDFLNKKLEEKSSLNSKEMDLLQNIVRETMEILSEMQKQIKDLPQELPDEFVNQSAVQQMNLGKIAESAKKLGDAIKSGDVSAALQMAKDLLSKVQSAKDALSKASENIAPWEKKTISDQLFNQQKKIDHVISDQEKLIQDTYRLEAIRKETELKKQKKLLTELLDRQRKVFSETLGLVQLLRLNLFKNIPNVISYLEDSIPEMEKIIKEMEQVNLLFSQKWLGLIIQRLDQGEIQLVVYEKELIAQASIHKSTSFDEFMKFYHSWIEINKDEKTILDILKNPPQLDEPFSTDEQSEFKRIGEMQQQLSQETKKIRSELNKLSSKTATLTPALMKSLKESGKEMLQAQNALDKNQSHSAIMNQQNAVKFLREGKERVEGVQGELNERESMKKNGSLTSGASKMIQKREAQQGENAGGVRRGLVEIPSAQDYIPSRQFREELLESLKEKIPAIDEEMIKNYFKKLSD